MNSFAYFNGFVRAFDECRDRHEAKRNGGALSGFRGFPREPFYISEVKKGITNCDLIPF